MGKREKEAAGLALSILPGASWRPALPAIAEKRGFCSRVFRETQTLLLNIGEMESFNLNGFVGVVDHSHALEQEGSLTGQIEFHEIPDTGGILIVERYQIFSRILNNRLQAEI